MLNFDNLARKNIVNVKTAYKENSCDNLYEDEKDSYVSLVHIDTFKKYYEKYINNAKERRIGKKNLILLKECK